MSNDSNIDIKWMTEALKDAKDAMEYEEIPVASILVGGDTELSRSQTRVKREGSINAHGELFALLRAGDEVWSADRPLTIYTTLEPCLMCLGAAMQSGVDRIVFGMKAAPDGSACLVNSIEKAGFNSPKVSGGLLEDDAVDLMKDFKKRFPESPAIDYVVEMLNAYN